MAIKMRSGKKHCGKKPPGKKQGGSIIIVVLWTVALVAILATALASRVRLSAKVAFHQQEGLRHWAMTMAAVNQAEMELMLERMPLPPISTRDLTEADKNPAYRFNGQSLQLHYPINPNIIVRIYDHAGKINLRKIGKSKLRQLLQKRLESLKTAGLIEDMDVEELLAAWSDWLDLNNLKTIKGAEKDYYEALEQPYTPRNGRLETVEEIRHIRGFAELFKQVNLSAAFTLYGKHRTVNINLASKEALQLLPGLDDKLIEELLNIRQKEEFRNKPDVAEIVPAENMLQLSSWIGTNTSNFYTIFAYPRLVDESKTVDEQRSATRGVFEVDDEIGHQDVVSQAYMEIVEVKSTSSLPKVLKVDPYGKLPWRPPENRRRREG